MGALNDRDKRWLSEEIGNKVGLAFKDVIISQKILTAVEQFRPKRWQRASENIVAIGSPIAIIGIS